jgi:hypothetical protein
MVLLILRVLSQDNFSCNSEATSTKFRSPPMPAGGVASDSSLPPSPGGNGDGFAGSRPSIIRKRLLISRMVDSCLRISSIPLESVLACCRRWAASDRNVSSSQISPLLLMY